MILHVSETLKEIGRQLTWCTLAFERICWIGTLLAVTTVHAQIAAKTGTGIHFKLAEVSIVKTRITSTIGKNVKCLKFWSFSNGLETMITHLFKLLLCTLYAQMFLIMVL